MVRADTSTLSERARRGDGRPDRHGQAAYRRPDAQREGDRRQRVAGTHGARHRREEHRQAADVSPNASASPFYVIGEATGDMQFTFVDNRTGEKPIDLKLEDMFGKAPRTVLTDRTVEERFAEPRYTAGSLNRYIENVLQMEAVACKDWLTNKVDRSVTGKVAMQQTAGEVQLPLNDCAVVALDYQGAARHRHGARTCGGRRDGRSAQGIGDGHYRGVDEYRLRPDRRRFALRLAERQLDVALQERGRGRAALRGRTGGQRLCGGPRNQHTDRQGLAVDDAEVPRRRARLRAGNGHHHFGGRGLGRQEGGFSGLEAPSEPDRLRRYEPLAVRAGRQQLFPEPRRRRIGSACGRVGRLFRPGVRRRTGPRRRREGVRRARRVGRRPRDGAARDDVRRQPQRHGSELCRARRARRRPAAFQREARFGAAGRGRRADLRGAEIPPVWTPM